MLFTITLVSLFPRQTKCLQYWSNDGPTTYSDILVTTEKEDVFLDYTVRSFRITKVNTEQPHV